METKEYMIKCGKEYLACSVDYHRVDQKPTVISLHGGGLSSRENISYLSDIFVEHGESLVRFDFSGQGDSTGNINQSSLRKRYDEAASIIDHFKMERPLTIIGTSMGGYIASKLVEKYPVEKLILFCPAAYTVDAWEVDFGNGFTEIIRRKDSYLKTDIGKCFERFFGKALLFIGSEDEVIPQEVLSTYQKHLNCEGKYNEVLIDNCPHTIHRWSENKEDVREFIKTSIKKMLAA